MNVPSRKSKTRRLIRAAVAIALGIGLVSSLSASADWSVYDSRVEQQLKDVNKTLGSSKNGTVAGNLNNLRTIGKGDFNKDTQDGEKQGKYKAPPLEIKQAPGVNQPSWDKPSLADLSEDTRCPAPNGGTVAGAGLGSMQSQQWQICKEIRDTERAQIKYNLMMSDLSGKRYERLKEIQDERQNFRNETDAGLLQSNTNKMLALVALIQIDQQQQKAYNEAYQARLGYLRGNQERLSQLAIHGTPPTLADAAKDAAGYAGFAAALGISTQFD